MDDKKIAVEGENRVHCHDSHPGHQEEGVRHSHHSDEMKNILTTRLNRIEGQIRGIKGMIERDTYCDDVLTQIAAVQSALNGVGKLLLEGHMKSCVIDRIQAGEHEVIDELLVTVKKLMK
ncbi:metal-sensitive transcriptional regulator [Paenibacillus urinalis]|uniref:Metal-sensitive transcriptional regulator n=1 Tax=Paenibacillus urinalis TaxID=521520 RepID=A0AAX3N2S9_9BACL|nr:MULTISPECIES: metal-sensitive transcriptional regulator [Paenibacillus]WDH82979.1 metal-sensitive transcriptional regulator [Paenibacillus urinalis]WDH99031.1 metal-sensitive transcriptional regulator [Paenibacillus urinalis]WDI02724.1 metal-sensitive transcriptional regulator [Paenibacillus urinalis]GAK40207.1 copper-sensing transcriptional repressor CsoR [Paenibacillus sp. TCA20]